MADTLTKIDQTPIAAALVDWRTMLAEFEATSVPEVLEEISTAGISDNLLAGVLDVDPKTIRLWRSSGSIPGMHKGLKLFACRDQLRAANADSDTKARRKLLTLWGTCGV